MYFAGIYIHEHVAKAAAVVFEKVLRNAKKEYHIKDICSFSWAKSGQTMDEDLRSLLDNERFLRKKRVFSQSKRPPKNTFTPPLLIVSVENGGTLPIDQLRQNRIPVDALLFDHPDGWTREDLKILRFGTNYHLHPGQMDTLKTVLSSPRIILDSDLPLCTALRDEMARCPDKRGLRHVWSQVCADASFQFLPALLSALWHCETIYQVKRY